MRHQIIALAIIYITYISPLGKPFRVYIYVIYCDSSKYYYYFISILKVRQKLLAVFVLF